MTGMKGLNAIDFYPVRFPLELADFISCQCRIQPRCFMGALFSLFRYSTVQCSVYDYIFIHSKYMSEPFN